MSSPVPKSPEQSDKSRKYDRQIRLWGDHGQALLESATVCLVNGTALGCEILKGLILPGIGCFTLVDNSTATEDDVGVNFFLDVSCVGLPRGISCTRLLQDLNSDASGDCVEESVEYIIANRPTFFNTFTLVIGTNLSEKTLLELSNHLWDTNTPFIYCRSLGMIGSIRIQIKEHCIIETHPDNLMHDLRLAEPFPALKKHFEETEVTNKVPWLLVLNKFLKKWQEKTGKRAPQNYKEKCEIRDMIRAEPNSEDDNHQEAIKAINTVFGGGTVPESVKALFNDDACINLDKYGSRFWIMVRALKDFVEKDNNGLLPLAGVLPDMTAASEPYINLQNVYRQQALQDADNIYQKCQTYLQELGQSGESITDKTVRLFCREAARLTVMRGTKISDEYEKNDRVLAIVDDFESQSILIEQYMGLRAYERFLNECGNVPGECYAESDIARLKSVATKMLSDWGAHVALSDDMVHEICRYGGAEMHSVSAFLGGCAAQEAIKIITKQYKPIDNTMMFNGMGFETGIFNF